MLVWASLRSAPPLAGKDAANPMATILATAEMLRWLGTRKADDALTRAGDAVERAVIDVLAAGEPLPADLVGDDRAAPMSKVASAIRDKTVATLAS